MECIELVKEKNGIVSIGGCKLGDKPSFFYENMGRLCTGCHQIDTGLLGCTIDIDTMRIDNPVYNSDIEGIDIYCYFNKEYGIRGLKVYMNSFGGYPISTLSEYKDLVKTLSTSGRFEVAIRGNLLKPLLLRRQCDTSSSAPTSVAEYKKQQHRTYQKSILSFHKGFIAFVSIR